MLIKLEYLVSVMDVTYGCGSFRLDCYVFKTSWLILQCPQKCSYEDRKMRRVNSDIEEREKERGTKREREEQRDIEREKGRKI
jgi:hypothetical protein